MNPDNFFGFDGHNPHTNQQGSHPQNVYPEPREHVAAHQPPMHPDTPPPLQHTTGMRPTPVVKVLSPFGVEYVFMTIALFIAGFALTGLLLMLVNGQIGFSSLAFPTAMLVVSVPVFAGLFLHLKKMELQMPELKYDASKRRSTQFTQIVAFLSCIFTLIGFVYVLFASIGGGGAISIGKAALNALCILAVAGGVLAYYWYDEHVVRR